MLLINIAKENNKFNSRYKSKNKMIKILAISKNRNWFNSNKFANSFKIIDVIDKLNFLNSNTKIIFSKLR